MKGNRFAEPSNISTIDFSKINGLLYLFERIGKNVTKAAATTTTAGGTTIAHIIIKMLFKYPIFGFYQVEINHRRKLNGEMFTIAGNCVSITKAR